MAASPRSQASGKGDSVAETRALARILWRNRASSVAAVAMLGCAVTAASVTFAVADATLWRKLPYRQPDQLMLLVTTHTGGEVRVSVPDFLAARERLTTTPIAAAGSFTPEFALTGFGEPRQLRGRVVSADYFRTLGVPLVEGRDVTRDEEKPGAGFVVIITDRLRRQFFEGRSDILGAHVVLNSLPYTIVGILPPHRDFMGDVDLYVPYQYAPTLLRRLRILAPIVRVDTARRDLFQPELRLATAAPTDPDAAGYVVSAVDLATRLAEAPRASVMLLFGAGLSLLTIGILNFAMLSAAWTRQRQSEFSTRIAMGATHATIIRLAAMEAGALCLAAAVTALLMSRALVPLLQAKYGAASVSAVAVNGRTMAFAVATLIVALGSALLAVKGATKNRAWAHRTVAVSRLAAGRGLVIAQLGFSLTLTAGSALLVRSFVEQQRVDPGFRVADRYTSRLALPMVTYRDPTSWAHFWRTLLNRLQDIGLDAAITTELPLTGEDNPVAFVAQLANGQTLIPKVRSISSRYFELMGMPVLDGRGLADTDRAGAPLVVAVNQRLARQLPSGGSATGQTLTFNFGNGPQTATIVCIVADIHHEALNVLAAPEAYFTFEQTPLNTYSLVMSSSRDAGAVSRALRSTLDTIDSGRPFSPVTAFTEHLERSLEEPRLLAQLLGSFAAVAMIVAAGGLYSLLTFLIRGARQEWAIRLAVGATSRDLQKLVLRQSVAYAAAGSAVGIVLLIAVASPLSDALYGVTVWDPVVVGGTALLLALVSVLAAALPAREAARVAPAEALQR
jgi:putative ABC transport system permease protein